MVSRKQAYIVNCVGYSNNEKNQNNGFSYNLMLINRPYHIKGELKRTPIMLAWHSGHVFRLLTLHDILNERCTTNTVP